MKLISLSDLKSWLGKADTVHDVELGMLIDQVSARIETALNRSLRKEQRIVFFNAGRRHYWVDAYPIDAAAAITVEVDGSAKTKDSDFYIWEKDGVIEFQTTLSWSKPKQVKITWTGGYVETAGVLAVPDDMKKACLMQCAFEFRRRNDIGLSSINMPDGSISVLSPAKLLPEVEAIIANYRKLPTEC